MDRPVGTPDTESGVASLISLFNKIIVRHPGGEVPANAVAPKDWVVFSIWDTEPGDEKKEYYICTQVLYPDNSPFGDLNRTRVNITSGRNRRSQITINCHAFPIGQVGLYKVQTWIEENKQKVYGPIEFAIEVQHETAK
jgi:hypothetical protein